MEICKVIYDSGLLSIDHTHMHVYREDLFTGKIQHIYKYETQFVNIDIDLHFADLTVRIILFVIQTTYVKC